MKKGLLVFFIGLLMATTAFAAASEAPASEAVNLTVVEKMRAAGKADSNTEVSMKEKMEQLKMEETPEIAKKQDETIPRVAILYINNAKSTYDDEVDQSILTALGRDLPEEHYLLVDGAPYIEKLNKVGIVDISTAERADIVDVFQGENVDYCIFLEVQPFVARDKMTFFTVGKDITTAVPFKIIDLVNGKYLYNGKFTEKASDSSMLGGIGNKSVALKALGNVNEQVASVISTRLPETKPVKVQATVK